MKKEIISTLINRYDYSGAYGLAASEDNQFLVGLLDICRHMVNFDFINAQRLLTKYGAYFPLELSSYLEKNLMELIYGDPSAIFSEHLSNIAFQVEREEYIDLLGRVYRFNEAFMKYIFSIQHQEVVSVFDEVFEEDRTLRVLRKRYKIHNRNVIFAVAEYIYKFSRNPSLKRAANFITGSSMKALADLRNASIVGHGFEAVSYDDIRASYGEPQVLIKDIETLMVKSGLVIDRDKYKKINSYLLKELRYEK